MTSRGHMHGFSYGSAKHVPSHFSFPCFFANIFRLKDVFIRDLCLIKKISLGSRTFDMKRFKIPLFANAFSDFEQYSPWITSTQKMWVVSIRLVLQPRKSSII